MYDTLKIWVYGVDELNFHIDGLKRIYSNKYEDPLTVGNFKNFRIVHFSNILIIEGSLAKFYFGENLKTLTLNQSKEALNELSSIIGNAFDNTKVTKIHFGTNIKVQYPPQYYFDCFIRANRYAKYIYPTSVLFTQSNKAMEFYDKIAEMKLNAILEMNIIRYEIKFNKNIERELKFEKVTVADLINPAFYLLLKRQWRDKYFKILKKKERYLLEPGLINSQKSLIEILSIYGLHCLTIENLYKYIEKDKHLIKKQNLSNIRKKINSLANSSLISLDNYLIEELNEKIKKISESDDYE